jgi:hypothetical protein
MIHPVILMNKLDGSHTAVSGRKPRLAWAVLIMPVVEAGMGEWPGLICALQVVERKLVAVWGGQLDEG